MAKTLTEKSVKAITPDKVIEPGKKRKEVADGLQTGLYLVVQLSGQRSWAVRYRHQGRTRKATLGAYPAVKLADARKLAQATLRAASEGADPGAEKVAARKAALAKVRAARKRNDPAGPEVEAASPTKGTVAAVWADYERMHLATKRKSTRDAAVALYKKRLSAKWAGTPIADIKRRDVLSVIDELKADGFPAAANRALAVISSFFNWEIERNKDEDEDENKDKKITTSPCANIKRPAKTDGRARKLDEDELRRLWVACDGINFPFGPIVRLLILTGARRSEVAGMTDGELQLKKQIWRLPASRTKTGRSISIHLSNTAVGIITSLQRVTNDSNFLFCTKGKNAASGFSRAKSRIDTLMGDDIEPWTFHDIRRTVATHMQRIGVRFEVIEQCLNHKIQGVAGTYQRYGFEVEMAKAFDNWSVELHRIVSAKETIRASEPDALINVEAFIAVANE